MSVVRVAQHFGRGMRQVWNPSCLLDEHFSLFIYCNLKKRPQLYSNRKTHRNEIKSHIYGNDWAVKTVWRNLKALITYKNNSTQNRTSSLACLLEKLFVIEISKRTNLFRTVLDMLWLTQMQYGKHSPKLCMQKGWRCVNCKWESRSVLSCKTSTVIAVLCAD